jgi:Fe2+ transport system protein B
VLVEFDIARRNSILIAQNKLKSNNQVVAVTTPSEGIQPVTAPVAVAAVPELSEPSETVAKKLSSSDIKKLVRTMENKNLNSDQRSLAIEMLSRNQSVDSLKKLENFVATKPSALSKIFHKNQIESALRAQAIEGIAAFPEKDLALSSLSGLDPKVDESFLKDRIKKSMAEIKNQVENSEVTDTNALRKLVE